MSKINKLGLGIVVFDDVCHLKSITAEIRDLCDTIVVCLQNVSYHGDPIQKEVVEYAESLKNEGFIDEVITFVNTKSYKDKKTEAREIETNKRNYILNYLEKTAGCSHSMIIDSDEFYDHDDFMNAKNIIDNSEDVIVTYCQYINYYRDYRHVLVWPVECFVPFITEAKFRFDFHHGSFNKPSDPTRRYRMDGPDMKYAILNYGIVKMHHLSWIRKDIEKKIDNWSAKKLFPQADELKQKIIDRYNNYQEGQNAIILFNVPEYSVVVNRLREQYIHPKYPLI